MSDDRLRVRPKSITRRKWYRDRGVIDHNALAVGRVVNVTLRGGDHYVVVDFAGRAQELLLIDDDAEGPRTPHFIREARADKPGDWYRWQLSKEAPFPERDPCGECTATIEVHVSASASADRQQTAVDHFTEVVAFTLRDILEDDLAERGEADSSDIQASTKVLRTARYTFAATITVRLFTQPATAEDLARKLYDALASDAGDVGFWPDVLRQRGVEYVHASSFTFAGWAGSQRIAPLKGRLRLR
jgi:hypothetical protein